MGGGDHVVAYPHFLLTLSLFLQCLGSVPDPRPTDPRPTILHDSRHSALTLRVRQPLTKVWFLSKCLVIGPIGAEQGQGY